jgi:hypothetical protein
VWHQRMIIETKYIVIPFIYFLIITAHMNVIPLETARGEYEVHVLDERIESGGYRPFKYTVTILNERRTRDDP